MSFWTSFPFFVVLGIFLGTLVLLSRNRRQVYLQDFAVYRGEEYMKLDHKKFDFVADKTGATPESASFLKRVFSKSTIGDALFPPQVMVDFPNNTHRVNFGDAMFEAKTVIFDVVEKVLQKSQLKASQVDILIVNCSLFCPTPSLSAMIVNQFKMREDIKSFNLGGMGCSASVIGLDLAKDLLRLPDYRYALLVSTENTTLHWYRGKERSMLIANTIFRVGGAAIVLTNQKKTAKLKLLHCVRTHKGRDDACFNAVFQEEDSCGKIGVRIDKQVMDVAGKALLANIAVLAPMTLPWIEQIRYLLNACALKLLQKKRGVVSVVTRQLTQASFFRSVFSLQNGEKPYVPDFCLAFNYFCIHAGGHRVIDAIEKSLNLPRTKTAVSREILSRYGNTSSSSIWYELHEHLHNSKIKKGEKIWQIAFGSGFKCNSAVWEFCQH